MMRGELPGVKKPVGELSGDGKTGRENVWDG